MLVLTRKLTEEIAINGHIKIKVLSIQGNRVKLGIDAPEEVSIVRVQKNDTETSPVLTHTEGPMR